ncbi:PhzF family phenazine biosynthesis protein [Gudongella sp. DL1XJH-153]|uniref:PhzF family phenazine biosynthesis protein n=2 Tax=Bacillota TaxID=1239 RepID=UPI003BB5C1CE
MEVNIFQVDAFTREPFGGNPAGVITNSKGISEENMQKIANEMNLSETAFVRQLDDCYFKIRYFTPLCEVDLCGHATIAAIHTLANKGYIRPIENGSKMATIETGVGPLQVEIDFENFSPVNITMSQDKPRSVGVVEDTKELLECFGLDGEDVGVVDEKLAPEMISTGLPDIMLPIRDKETLLKMEVDFCRLRDLSIKLGVTGVHAFYIEAGEEIAHARNFGPAVGIDEEAATGTANGALIYYLKKNGILKGNSLVVHQGESMNRRSIINCYIEGTEDNYSVKVGGSATIVMEGIIKF